MARPRSAQVSIGDTPYYHIVSRCVRRTFLCGRDAETGRDFSHRRRWIEQRIRLLASLFGVDIAAYAVMSNHYHLVVRLTPQRIEALGDEDVLNRWASLYKGPPVLQLHAAGRPLSSCESDLLKTLCAVYRARLVDLSWFMKCLNEPIARMANREDDCTGHFWESRFKSQALRDDTSLLSAMAYVDLNPVRAAIADTPETSEYTSLRDRVAPAFDMAEAVRSQLETGALQSFTSALRPLIHFSDTRKAQEDAPLPFTFREYLTLVDATGRQLRSGTPGAIPRSQPPILQRLSFPMGVWLECATRFEELFARRTLVASPASTATTA